MPLTYSNPSTLVSTEEFRSLRLSFSPNLDDYNPDIPEWRRDVSRVIKKALVEVSVASSFWPSLMPAKLSPPCEDMSQVPRGTGNGIITGSLPFMFCLEKTTAICDGHGRIHS